MIRNLILLRLITHHVVFDPTAGDLSIFCQDEHLKRGRVLKGGTFSQKYHKYYTCGVNGCAKQYRAVISLFQIDREQDKPFILEHVTAEAHDHDGVDVVFRGALFTFID